MTLRDWEKEWWKPVPLVGMDSLVEVSDRGRVRIAGVIRRFSQPKKNRYKMVPIRFHAHSTIFPVHRLVAMAFCRPGRPVVNHKNLVKSDNRADNLEWVSKREDSLHAHANGAYDKKYGTITIPIDRAKEIAAALGGTVATVFKKGKKR